MSFSACKVPINCRLEAAIDSFHQLREDSRWRKLRQEQRDRFNERAIKIDQAAIEGYDALNNDMVTALDSLAEFEE